MSSTTEKYEGRYFTYETKNGRTAVLDFGSDRHMSTRGKAPLTVDIVKEMYCEIINDPKIVNLIIRNCRNFSNKTPIKTIYQTYNYFISLVYNLRWLQRKPKPLEVSLNT